MFIFTLSDKGGFTQLLDKQQALNKVTSGCVLLLHSEMVTIKNSRGEKQGTPNTRTQMHLHCRAKSVQGETDVMGEVLVA